MTKTTIKALIVSLIAGIPVAIIATITNSVPIGIAAGSLQMITYFFALVSMGAMKINDKIEK